MSKKNTYSRKWRDYVKAVKIVAADTITGSSTVEEAKKKVADDLVKTMKQQRKRVAAQPRIK